jgi:hypothetical protein
MKNIYFILFIIFFCVINCFAQDTVERKNRFSDSLIERFYVLKSNPEIRQGPYTVFLHRRIVIARGRYNNNKKAGTWFFFDTGGKLVERYNYDKNKFSYEAPPYTSEDLRYLFDDSLKNGDKITMPIKIGGVYFGYIPYVSLFHLPFDSEQFDTDAFDAYVELLISPLGRLADYKVRVVSAYYEYDQTFNLDVNLFSEADRTFVPAKLNGVPVMSRILIKCYVTTSGGLDFY